MRKLLLGAILLFSTLGFSQSETITINTNKMVGLGMSVDVYYEIVITDKLLTLRLTDEKYIKDTQKYSTYDLSKPLTLVDFDLMNVKFVSKINDLYTYQGKNIRIQLLNGEHVKSLTLETKDDFTGDITKLIYIKL